VTASDLNDRAWSKYPFTYRNNRGCARTENGFVRYGIPEPKGKEAATDPKGGDRIGFIEVKITPDMVGKTIAIFANIEIKGAGDRLVAGQSRFHNFILDHGGISQVWKSTGEKTFEVIESQIEEE
jgi:hypothetical protein